MGTATMNPSSALDEMTHRRRETNSNNGVEQLRLVAGLCNSGEFDAATDDSSPK